MEITSRKTLIAVVTTGLVLILAVTTLFYYKEPNKTSVTTNNSKNVTTSFPTTETTLATSTEWPQMIWEGNIKARSTVPSMKNAEPSTTTFPSITFEPKYLTTVGSSDQNVSTIKIQTAVQPQQPTSKSKAMDSATTPNPVVVEELNVSTATPHSILEDKATEFTKETTTSGADLMLSSTIDETTPDSPIVHGEPTVGPDLMTILTDGHDKISRSTTDTLTEEKQTATTMLDYEIVTMYDGVAPLSGESVLPDPTVSTTHISKINELIITEIYHTTPVNTIEITGRQVTPAYEMAKTGDETTSFEELVPESSTSRPNRPILETSESISSDNVARTTDTDLDGVWIYRPMHDKSVNAVSEMEMTFRPTLLDNKILTESPHTNLPSKMPIDIDETQNDPTDQSHSDLPTETLTLKITEAIHTEATSKIMESVSNPTTPTMLNEPGNYDSDSDHRMSEYENHNHPNMSISDERVDSDDSTNGTWTESETIAALEPEIYQSVVPTTTEMEPSATQTTPESLAQTSGTIDSTYPPTKAPMIGLTTPLIVKLLSNVYIPPEIPSVPIGNESRDPINLTATLSNDSLGTTSELTYLSPDVEGTSSEPTVSPGDQFNSHSEFDENDQNQTPPSYNYQINLEMTDGTDEMADKIPHTIAPATSFQTTKESGLLKLLSGKIEPPIGMSTVRGTPTPNMETDLAVAEPERRTTPPSWTTTPSRKYPTFTTNPSTTTLPTFTTTPITTSRTLTTTSTTTTSTTTPITTSRTLTTTSTTTTSTTTPITTSRTLATTSTTTTLPTSTVTPITTSPKLTTSPTTTTLPTYIITPTTFPTTTETSISFPSTPVIFRILSTPISSQVSPSIPNREKQTELYISRQRNSAPRQMKDQARTSRPKNHNSYNTMDSQLDTPIMPHSREIPDPYERNYYEQFQDNPTFPDNIDMTAVQIFTEERTTIDATTVSLPVKQSGTNVGKSKHRKRTTTPQTLNNRRKPRMRSTRPTTTELIQYIPTTTSGPTTPRRNRGSRSKGKRPKRIRSTPRTNRAVAPAFYQ